MTSAIADIEMPIADVAGNLAYDKRELLWCCIQYLAGQCDHAYNRDGTGFNKRDTERGHRLAKKNLRHWTKLDEYNAWKICMTYKNTQLSLWSELIPAWVKNPGASADEVYNKSASSTLQPTSRHEESARQDASTPISTEDFAKRILADLTNSGLLHDTDHLTKPRRPTPGPTLSRDNIHPVIPAFPDRSIRDFPNNNLPHDKFRLDESSLADPRDKTDLDSVVRPLPYDRSNPDLTLHPPPHDEPVPADALDDPILSDSPDRSILALTQSSSSNDLSSLKTTSPTDCPRPFKNDLSDLSSPPTTTPNDCPRPAVDSPPDLSTLRALAQGDMSVLPGTSPTDTFHNDDLGPAAADSILPSPTSLTVSGNGLTDKSPQPVFHPTDKAPQSVSHPGDITIFPIPTLFTVTTPPPPIPRRHGLTVVERNDNEFVEVTLETDQTNFRSLLNEIRMMPQRKYDGVSRKWTIPLEIDTVEKIHYLIEKYDIETPEDVYGAISRTVSDHRERAALSLATEHEIDLPDIEGEPFGYQNAGIAFLLKTPRGLCADAMGLGKTLQAIATLVTSGDYPAIIVVPASVKINWKRELKKWSPVFRERGTIAIIEGRYNKMIGKKVENLAVVENLNLENPNSDPEAILRHVRADGQIMMIGDSALSARATAIGIRSYRRGDLGDMWPLAAKNVKAIIINYDLVESWREFLIERFGENKFTLICDEAHRLKNSEAKRTKAITGYFVDVEENYIDAETGEVKVKLSRRWEKGLSDHDLTLRTILLTGTPVVNRPDELWSLIRILGLTRLFGTKEKYEAEYTGRDIGKLQQLNKVCRANFMIRRKKEQVLKDLPPKIWHDVPIEIDNREEYDRAERELAEFFAESKIQSDKFERDTWKYFCEFHGIGNVLFDARYGYADWPMFYKVQQENQYGKSFAMAVMNERLLRWGALKKVAVKGKFAGVANWIEEFLDDSDESLIVFGWHNEFLEKLSEQFKSPLIYGATNLPTRTRYVDEFQAKKHRIIFGNIQAMGEGLTLTASSNVAFFEFGWNPKDQEQAEDRAHRIGQLDNVMVHHLIADDTIDEEILAIISNKRKVTNAIQDGDGIVETSSILDELEQRMAQRIARKKGN